MDNEEKYIDIANKLKNLEKVEASHNFTHNLQAKIIELESERRKEHAKRNEESKGGFLRDLFKNIQYPWLVPAAGFTILIFFVFYITYQNKDVLEKRNDSPVTQESQSINENNPGNQNNTSEDQNQQALTENKETEKDLNPQETENENNVGKETDRSLSDEKIKARTLSENGADKKTDKDSKYSESNLNPEPAENENLSADTEERSEITETKNQDDNKSTEYKGMVSEEKTRTMAKVKPEAKDTNASKKDNNSEIRNLMLKIKQIDRKALEQIQEEISK